MPQRPPAHVSPQSSNPTSPSGRPGSPRRRKSLELPDMQKLSFTPAAPQPTTATTTSNANAAPNAKAPNAAAAASAPPPPAAVNAAAPPPTSPGSSRKWQQALGGRVASPLGGPGLAPMSKVDKGVVGGVTVVPVNDSSTYFPSQPIPIRSPRGQGAELPPATAAHAAHDRPHPPSSSRRPEVKLAETPVPTGLTPPPPTVSPTPPPAEQATATNDGLVDVPIQWNGGGKNVYVTGNFADKWRGRVKLKKSTHDFNTILRLAPGQYKLKFIVDDSWRCSKAIPTATDDDGTLVNWIEVEAPKTEAELQAEWAMDSKPAVKAEDVDDSQWTSEIPASLVLYQYLEELPQMFPPDVLKQYVASSPYFSPVPKPPQLPRILEKVILNTDTRRPDPREQQDGPPAGGIDDNAILATPSHAVLNHLMASAIKNGTLGVGTTTRYRKKYITTMFFRPTPSDLMPTQEQAAAGQAAAAAAGAPAEANGAAAPPTDTTADAPPPPAEHATPVPPAAAQ
ncbi:galactose metabolism-related protein [Vanrija albida]|uniref:Galactose metabolism-related protein n=1 Tax=Vanrija albida TaxID=181172 RepID=A0ABR3Q196_9TREE